MDNEIFIDSSMSQSAIQAALNNAAPGAIVHFADGTYTLNTTLEITQGLSIVGASRSGVIFDASGIASGGYAISVTADDVTLQGFTLIGGGSTGPHRGIKASPPSAVPTDAISGLVIQDVAVSNFHRAEIDLNGVDDSTLSDVFVDGANTGGAGIALTDANDITLHNITTENNGWGGVGIYSKGEWYTGGSDGVTFTGTFSSTGEAQPIYTETQSGFGGPFAITGMVLPADYDYAVYNNAYRPDGAAFLTYFDSEADATQYALAIQELNPLIDSDDNSASVIYQNAAANGQPFTTGAIVVSEGMSIQAAIDGAAPNSTIFINPGVYNENIVIDVQGLTLVATAPGVILRGDYKEANDLGGTVFQGLKTATGYSGEVGVTIVANGVTLDGINVDNFMRAIVLGGQDQAAPGAGPLPNTDIDVANITLKNLDITSFNLGLHKGGYADVTNLRVENVNFDDGYMGVDFVKNTNAAHAANGNATGVTFDDVDFTNILQKGIYAETLSDARLTGIDMNNVGQYGGVPTHGVTGLHGNGINLNLKNGAYSDIEIDNFNLVNTGLSNKDGTLPSNSTAGSIVIAARDDGGTYGPAPATVSDVRIHDGTISGPGSTGIRAGEAGRNNAGPSLDIDNVLISGTQHSALHGDIGNEGQGTVSVSGTSGVNNYIASGNSDGRIVFVGDPGNDTYAGGSASDTVDYSATTQGVTVNDVEAYSTGATDEIGYDTLSSIENVIGGSGDDEFYSTAAGVNNTFVGGAGNDSFSAGSGTDTFVYEAATAADGIATQINAVRIVVNGGAEGTDDLRNVERILFRNGTEDTQDDILIEVRNGNAVVYSRNDEGAADEDNFAASTGNVLTNDINLDQQAPGVNADVKKVVSFGAGEDAGAALAGSSVEGTYGALVIHADGTYTYTPSQAALQHLALGAQVQEVFTYTASDNVATDTDTATLTITISGRNDAPVISASSVTTGTAWEHGDLDNVTPASSMPGASINGTYSFDPGVNYDSVFAAWDEVGDIASTADIQDIVDALLLDMPAGAGTRDAIAAIWDFYDDSTMEYGAPVRDHAMAWLGVYYAGYLQQAGSQPLTDVIAKYRPDGDDIGGAPDRLQPLHHNLLGNVSAGSMGDRLPSGTISAINLALTGLGLGGLPNRPWYSGDEGAVDAGTAWDQSHGLLPTASGQLSASDVDDGAVLTWEMTGSDTAYGSFLFNAATQTWTYSIDQGLTQGLAEGQSATQTATFTVTDQHGASDTTTVTVTIHGANDAPVLSLETYPLAIDEDQSVQVSHAAVQDLIAEYVSDADLSDEHHVSVSIHNGATLVYAYDSEAGGDFNFDPATAGLANFHGQLTVTIVARDEHGAVSNPAIYTLAVNSVADLTGANSADSGDEDGGAITGDLNDANDTTSRGTLVYSLHGDEPAHGNLTLNANGEYSYTPDANYNGIDSFSYLVTDAASGESAVRTVTITVEAQPDAAIIGGQIDGDVVEDGISSINGQLTIVDPDAGQQAFVPQTSVAGTYGTFTLDGDGTWTYALNHGAVQFLAEGDTETDSLVAAAIDGTTQVITVTITGTNDEPVATADTDEVDQGETITGNVLANDTDVDGDTLTVTSVNHSVGSVGEAIQGKYGVLTLNADGTYSYVANQSAPSQQTETFSYTVSDSKGGTDAYFIDFEAFDNGPITNDEPGWTISDPGYRQRVGGTGDKDWTFTREVVSGNIHQVFTPGLGQNAGEAGSPSKVTSSFEASFNVTALAASTVAGSYLGVSMDDGNGSRGNLLRFYNSADGVWHVEVADFVAGAFVYLEVGTLTPGDETKISFQQTFNDGPGNDVWTVYIDGEVVHSSGIGWEDYHGANLKSYDRLLFRASGVATSGDPGLAFDDVSVTTNQQSTLTIQVNGENDDAVISGEDSGAVIEAGVVAGTAQASGDLDSTDVDEGDADDSWTAGTFAGSYGQLTINAAGEWTYQLTNTNPAVDQLGDGASLTDTVTVSTADGTTKVITIAITGANDAPVLAGISDQTILEDETVSATAEQIEALILARVDDVDSGDTHYVIVTVNGAEVFDSRDGAFAYTPDADFNGSLNVAVTAYDQHDAPSNTQTFTLNVTSVNDAPDGADQTIEIEEDGSHSFTAADFGFSDAVDAGSNSGANSLAAVIITTLPLAGVLTLAGVAVSAGQSIAASDLGNLEYAPAADANGDGYSSFTFQVVDDGGTANAGQNTDQAANTITFDVTPQSDDPVLDDIDDQTILEDETVTATFQQVEDLILAAVEDADVGDSHYVIVTVNDVEIYDSRNALPFAYQPPPNFNGSLPVTVTVFDQAGNSASDMFSLNVTSVNDAPDGADKTIEINEDGSHSFTAADFGFTDAVDAGSLAGADALGAVIITTLPTAGALTLNDVAVSAGQSIAAADLSNLKYTPAANANGDGYASFTFQVVDDGGTANGGENTDQTANSITFDVAADNDAPVLQDLQAFVDGLGGVFMLEDGAVTVTAAEIADVLADLGDLDIDTAPADLQFTLVFRDADGDQVGDAITFSGVPSNGFTFSPPLNDDRYLTATLTVSDGEYSAESSFTVDLTPVNDAPAGADKTIEIDEDGWHSFTAADFGFTDANDAGSVAGANALGAVIITTLPTVGALTLNNLAVTAGQSIAAADLGNLTYVPVADASGAGYASFTFQVVDNGGTANGGQNTDQTANTITFDVAPQPDDASITVSGTPDLSVTEFNGVSGDASASGTLTVIDPDSGQAGLQSASGGIYGTFTVNPDGTWSYLLNNAHTAVQALNEESTPLQDSVTVWSIDGTDSHTIAVTINGQREVINGTEFDDAPLSGTSYGDIINGGEGDDQVSGGSGDDHFYDFVGDGSDTYNGGSHTLGDTLFFSGNRDDYTVTKVGPLFFFEHTDGTVDQATGIEFFKFADTGPLTQTTVLSTPADPTVADTNLAVVEDSANSLVLGNVFDQTSGPGPFTVTPQTVTTSYGTFTVSSNGTVLYQLNNGSAATNALAQGATHVDTLTVAVKGASGNTVTGSIKVTITGANDAPVGVNDTLQTIAENVVNPGGYTAFNGLLGNDQDPDNLNSQLVIDRILAVTNADITGFTNFLSSTELAQLTSRLSIHNGTEVRFQDHAGLPGVESVFDRLNPGETATVTFTYVVKDPAGLGSTAKATFSVTGAYEVYNGSGGADTISGSAYADAISAGGGSDVIVQSAGADLIDGGDGSDTVDYRYGIGLVLDLSDGLPEGGAAAGDTFLNIERFWGSQLAADTMIGDDNVNIFYGFSENDYLDGRGGNDLIYGGNGNDIIFGGGGNDILFGEAGSDTISGGAGDDVMWGGDSADYFVFDLKTIGADQIRDFQKGVDKIQFDLGAIGVDNAADLNIQIRNWGDGVVNAQFIDFDAGEGMQRIRVYNSTAFTISLDDIQFL